jgi:mono/diheme cytochrome c family protein
MNAEPDKFNTAEDPPSAGSDPTPVALLVALILLLLWGMSYLDGHGGGFLATVYWPYNDRTQVQRDQPPSEGDEVYRLGKMVYETKANCMVCHQANGLGLPNQFPPLAGSEWVLAKEPGRIIRIVLDGLQGPITVSGKEFGQATMVPWKENLTDEDIAAVLTYVRKTWGNNAPEVTSERVKAVRAKEASRSTSWTPDELLKIGENE